MKYNFKGVGIKLLIVSIVTIFLMRYINISFYYKLFIGTFLVGTSIFLTFFGKFNPPD